MMVGVVVFDSQSGGHTGDVFLMREGNFCGRVSS
jgi:hypothetical protein